MPILERTPPIKRHQLVREDVPSSPSRRPRPSPSPGQQTAYNAETYVFPSLEAMALPSRERAAATSSLVRTTPTLTSAQVSKPRGSVEASGGSRGTPVGRGGKVIGGQAGRNGPTLTTTAERLHPAIGARNSASSNTTARSSLTSKAVMMSADAENIKIAATSVAPAEASHIYPRIPASSSYDERPVGSRTTEQSVVTDREVDTFQEQMERALASGANPFQDRKRDQMREESRVSPLEEPRASTPKRMNPSREPIIASPHVSSPRNTEKIRLIHRDSIPLAASHTSPLSPVDARISPARATTSVASPTTRKEVLKLRIQIKEEAARVEELIKERETITEELRQRNRKSDMQREHIKELEGKVALWKAKAKEERTFPLLTTEHAWELVRNACKVSMSRAEDCRERDLEAIISRNEVTYMNARRGEGELDLQICQFELEKAKSQVEEAEEHQQMLQKNLDGTRKRAEDSESRLVAVIAKEHELKAALRAEEMRTLALESELKEMTLKLSEQTSEVQRLKQSKLSSPAKKSSPARTTKDSQSEVVNHPKNFATTSNILRQSPRKVSSVTQIEVMSRVASRSPSMQPRDSFSDDDGQEEEKIEPVKKSAATIKASKSKLKVAQEKAKQVSSDKDEIELEEHKLPKEVKKKSILNRARKVAGISKKETSTKVMGKSKADDEQSEYETQQTPMLPTKKRQGKLEVEDEEEENPEATPYLPTKNQVGAKSKAKTKKQKQQEEEEEKALFEDMTISKTPLIRKKRSANEDEDEIHSPLKKAAGFEKETKLVVGEKKKKRRMLKQTTNIAHNFINCNGDTSGDLNPGLNLPLQLSPIKDGKSTSSSGHPTLGIRSAAAASRLFGR